MTSREWNKEEKKLLNNFIDAVKSKNTTLQKEIEKSTLNKQNPCCNAGVLV